jgi:hypothetical protein
MDLPVFGLGKIDTLYGKTLRFHHTFNKHAFLLVLAKTTVPKLKNQIHNTLLQFLITELHCPFAYISANCHTTFSPYNSKYFGHPYPSQLINYKQNMRWGEH